MEESIRCNRNPRNGHLHQLDRGAKEDTASKADEETVRDGSAPGSPSLPSTGSKCTELSPQQIQEVRQTDVAQTQTVVLDLAGSSGTAPTRGRSAQTSRRPFEIKVPNDNTPRDSTYAELLHELLPVLRPKGMRGPLQQRAVEISLM